jgi:hypothetical protein
VSIHQIRSGVASRPAQQPRPPRRRVRRASGRIPALLLLLLLAALLPGRISDFVDSLFDREPRVAAAAEATSPEMALADLQAASPLFGLYTPDSPTDHAQIAAAETSAGTDARIVAYFADAEHPLDVSLLDAAAADGAIPMLSLETYGWTTADIAAGRYDAQIRTVATKLSQFNGDDGGVVLIRLNHEMNGHWYPWSEAEQGNHKGDYAASWRHFVDVVRESGTGSTNVLWVWSPNILRGAELDTMVDAYPGDDYVDYIGMTGYGDTGYERTPAQTFDPTIRAIREDVSADKPLIVTESGASRGKYRTQWTRALGGWLEANQDVNAFVWFDFDTSDGASTNWRFTDSPEVARALRQSLAEAGATPLATTSSK